MKISPLSMDLRAGKAPGSHAIELEAVSSAFSRMGSAAEALPSPDGLRPVRTAWRQPEDVAKDEYQVSPSAPLLTTRLDMENGWVCGSNMDGQLGVGVSGNVTELQPLGSGRWAALSFGAKHSVGVSGEGEVYTWGRNDSAQLGHNALQQQPMPMRLSVLRGIDVKAICCGSSHTVALTADEVITWGRNDQGQCGQGERAEVTWVKPRFIRMLSRALVTQVVCGSHHTLCVTATSQVYAWGRNEEGQLGLGDTAMRRTPTIVDALWALPVQQLAAGDRHSAALTSNGFLFTCGANDRGQLGLPTVAEVAAQNQLQRSASEQATVRRVANQRFLTAMLDMGFRKDHAELALAETGNVGVEVATEWLFACPKDVLDRHLHGSTPASPVAHAQDRVTTPRRVGLTAVRWIAAGSEHMVAVTDTTVHSWGCNSMGQLGLGHFREQQQPAEILSLHGHKVTSVACGAAHTLFLCQDGSVYGCGDATDGQLPCSKHELTSPPGRRDDDAACSYAEVVAASAPGRSPFAPGPYRPPMYPASRAVGVATPLVAPVPRRLRLTTLNPRSLRRRLEVCTLVAGGNGSGFLMRGAEELPEHRTPRLLDRLQQAITEAASSRSGASTSAFGGHQPSTARRMSASGVSDGPRQPKGLETAVDMIFGSAAATIAAFGLKDTVGVDTERLEAVQLKLLRLHEARPRGVHGISLDGGSASAAEREAAGQAVRDALGQAMERLLHDLDAHVKMLGTPERTQILLAATQTPLLSDAKWGVRLLPELCKVVLHLPSQARQYLILGWSEYKADLLQQRVVQPLQNFLTQQLQETKKLTGNVMAAIKTMAVVDQANQLGRVLPPEAFYNELISEKLDVDDHYIAWRQSHDSPGTEYIDGEGPFSFCSYPFLLNPRAKSKLLHTEAKFMMNHTVQQARVEQLHSPIRNRRASENDRVVPNSEAKIKLRVVSPAQAAADYQLRERRDQRRSGRSGVARSMWSNLWRGGSSDGESQSPERPSAASRQSDAQPGSGGAHGLTIDIPADSASDAASEPEPAPVSGLQRQGSMNLPPPEECGAPAEHPEMCILRIRRQHLIEDALDEIARQRPKDLFKPLRVHFIGEEGIDAGGVKKEFFQLLVAELLCPDYGMLIQNPETRTYWFNPSTLEAETEFMLVGLVLGLAIYNSVLLDFPLPIALYKKLVGQPPSLRDLSDMEPTVGKSLRELLNYSGPGSVEEVFCQTFTAGVPGIGEVRMEPLIPGGEDNFVNEENRREYVDAYVDFYLNRSVQRQFEAFERGFRMLCTGPALHLFSATELERLVCGNPILDFAALQKSARYEGGYAADHKVVKWLWDIVRELHPDDQRRFLKFFTGSDRAPIGGLGNLRCIIQRDGPDSNKLPTSHTCFNTLLLPSYVSRLKMEERLRLAIDWSAQGFGLE